MTVPELSRAGHPPPAFELTHEWDDDVRRLREHLSAAGTTAARRARHRFVDVHAERLYAELTDGSRERVSIAELTERAARLLPGLAPDATALAAEAQRAQRDKHGVEVDQAILLSGLLRGTRSGVHLAESQRVPTPRAQALLADFGTHDELDLGPVSVRHRDGVGEVVVQNTAYLNAEDDEVVTALEVAVDLVLLDDRVRVGVLRGGVMRHPRYAGRRVFNAGVNLTALLRGEVSFAAFFMARELGYLNKIYRGLVTDAADDWYPEPIEKPWVAAVDTFAIGGGTQQLLVFDRVVAESDAWFTLPALKEGIIPGVANLRLPRVAGGRLARQAIFDNRRIDAKSARGELLCDVVVDATDMTQAVADAAAQLTDPAIVPNRRMLHRSEEPTRVFCDYMADYALEQARLLADPQLIVNLERGWLQRPRSA